MALKTGGPQSGLKMEKNPGNMKVRMGSFTAPIFLGGEMEGLATYWYCNGQKQSEEQMSENYKAGIWKEWNKDGVQIQEFDYSQIPVELQQSR